MSRLHALLRRVTPPLAAAAACAQFHAAQADAATEQSVFALLKPLTPSRLPRPAPLVADETYDYIIVGGGSAGCVLAARLSEMRDKRVLLVEAGEEDNHPFVRVPAAMVKLFGSSYTYDYHSTPQTHKGGGRIYIPQGRGLGGSSSVNAMAYLRGSSYDYDTWGFPAWRYDAVLPYFRKSEHNLAHARGISPEAHGVDGPWRIDDVLRPHPLTTRVIGACAAELGLPIVRDFNADRHQQEGVGLLQVNIAEGRRNSVADAFLTDEVLRRDNLVVRTRCQVQRLLFDDGGAAGKGGAPRARGVLVSGPDAAAAVPVLARGEVLVCAGTMTSPRLLMVSGIGPPATLAKHSIPLVHGNAAVGAGLQDHPCMFMVRLLSDASLSLDALNAFPANAAKLAEWFVFRNNELANCAEMTGYIRSAVARANGEPAPDIQVGFIKALYIDHGKAAAGGRAGYALGPILLSPKSTGSVSISGPSIADAPVIDFNLFADPSDLDRVVDGCKALRRVIAGEAMAAVNGSGGYLVPEPTPPGADEDAWLRDQVRKHTNTIYHPVGTCGMGRVVDERLRVTGVRGLRVVDASIMPVIPRANTNAPTVMIAERAADFIKEELAVAAAAAAVAVR